MSTPLVFKPNSGIVLSILLAFGCSLSAQTAATWQGGKPGRATDWNCPFNWSSGRVPDEFTQVIIPTGKQFYPVIKDASTSIDALFMESGSTLAIREGARLIILGETGRFDGFTVFGQIRNDGTLEIGEAIPAHATFLKQVRGNNIVITTEGVGTLAKQW